MTVLAGSTRVRDLVTLAAAVALVGAVVVGVVGAERAATAATTTHRVTIPPAAFHPMDPSVLYFNNGDLLVGDGSFAAPIPLYRPGSKVQVLNMTLYAQDNTDSRVCAGITWTNPATGEWDLMTSTCSSGASPERRSFQVAVPKPRNVNQWQGPWVWLALHEYSPELMFYGVRITYRVTQ